MRKLIVLLFVSVAIPMLASDTYVYAPGLDSAIQHWQYPNTAAMTSDFGFYAQDVGKIAFNTGNGIYYYLSDPTPTWIPMATGGGGGSTTFIGLTDVPSSYLGAAGKLVVVNPGANGLIFQTATGGGNVTAVGTPALEDTVVWTDPTHIKNVRTLSGGTTGYVLTKLGITDYDYGWVAPTGGGSTVSITATSPIVVTPSPLTGTGVISLDPTSDLAALEALTGGNTIYYRSGTSAWSPVVIGANLTFTGGTLTASVTGGGGGTVTSISGTSPIQVSPNPITATGTVSLESGSDLAAIEALTGTNTIYYRSGVSAWSPVTIGSNMTFVAGSLAAGNANWDTAFSERWQWDGSATNLNATLGRGSLGATTIGANLFTLSNPLATSWIKLGSTGTTTLEDAATTKTSLGLNTANWDTAYTDRMKWDTSLGISGGTTGQGRTALGATTAGSNLFTLANPATSNSWMKVGTTGTVTLEDAPTTKTSLSLNNVTNDAQTQAAIMPNTAPTAGQIPVGSGTAYAKQTITGGAGETTTLTAAGVLTVATIPNAAITNPSINIAGTSVTLGGAITQDQITGLSATGIIKRYGGSSLAIAVAGTDYKVGTQNSINIRFVTVTGTFTPTAGVTSLYVEGVGGGGGGGGVKTPGSAGDNSMGGGGGGGGYSSVYIGTPAASYAVTIGAGGTGGVSTGGVGVAGGTTTFGAVLSAGGGAGGVGSTGAWQPGVYGAAQGYTGGVGGVPTIGNVLVTGSDGEPGWYIGVANGGIGGASAFGGSTMGAIVQGTGNAGANYGGGGSGAAVNTATGAAGGAGAKGLIRVWEIF